MDKIALYQRIILDFLEKYVKETTSPVNSEVEYHILADKNNLSFQLLALGWHDKHHIFGPIFHFDIKNNKIWMQCNNTEREVVDEFMAQGVQSQDIVLGFLPPYAREYSGFAVA